MAGWYYLLVSVWKSGGGGLTGETKSGVWVARAGNMTAREPPWKQNELPPMVLFMQIFLAKSQSQRGSSHQPAFMDSYLTISHTCLPCLCSR